MTLSASVDKLLRDLTAARGALMRSGVVIARTPYDERIDELRELCPAIICPDCKGRARGCQTCVLVSEGGGAVSMGIVCPHCTGAHWLRRDDPSSTRVAKLVACPSCMSWDGEHWRPNAHKQVAAIERALERAALRRAAFQAEMDEWTHG